MRSVLMIGGSVFIGRVFSIRASKCKNYDLHVVNRGNFPMQLDRVTQYKCNRSSPRMVARLIPDIKYDALIDFCGYTPGEIKPMIEALKGRVKHYIFFSTANIYAEKEGTLNESSELIDSITPMDDLVSSMVNNKILLENELIESCSKAGINYTILRPSLVYGPYNHAPRESYFIGLIARKEPVPIPIDATARFTMTYVLDIADALMTCIGNEKSHNQVYNLAGSEALDYKLLISAFEHYSGEPFDTREVTIAQVFEENIPLPFPLTENRLVDGSKFASTFDFSYTPFADGMKDTFDIFLSLYTTNS